MSKGRPLGRTVTTRPRALTTVGAGEPTEPRVATTEPPARLGLPTLAPALPTKGTTKRPGGILGPGRVLLATQLTPAMVTVEVISRRALLATVQTEGPLLLSTSAGVQDEQARGAARRTALRISA